MSNVNNLEVAQNDPYWSPRKSGRIEDAELAHDMGLAMQGPMDQVTVHRAKEAELSDYPEVTYRQTRHKAEYFKTLISEQMLEDKAVQESYEDYVKKTANRYHHAVNNTSYCGDRDLLGGPKPRITNGLVAELTAKKIDRLERHANDIGELIFFKAIESDNVIALESALSDMDREVFAPLPSEEKEYPGVYDEWIAQNPEITQVHQKASRLRKTLRNKRTVQQIADNLGIEIPDTYTRDDLLALAAITNNYYVFS